MKSCEIQLTLSVLVNRDSLWPYPGSIPACAAHNRSLGKKSSMHGHKELCSGFVAVISWDVWFQRWGNLATTVPQGSCRVLSTRWDVSCQHIILQQFSNPSPGINHGLQMLPCHGCHVLCCVSVLSWSSPASSQDSQCGKAAGNAGTTCMSISSSSC